MYDSIDMLYVFLSYVVCVCIECIANGVLLDKVRVADLIDGPSAISSTSSEDNSWEVNKVGASYISTFQGDVNEAEHDSELQRSGHTEGEEVSHGNLDTKNGFPVKLQDVEGKINTVDPSTPSVTTKDDP